ncbi:MAG: hypothetical protein ABI432_14595 [Flavobacteriales bacterium]
MEPTAVISLVLTSSVLAASLTAFMTWRVTRENYKNQYFAKLLDKRLDAYGTVEGILQDLKGFIVFEEDASMCPYVCAFGQEHFQNFIISLSAALGKSFWISDAVSNKLSDINAFIVINIQHQIDENGNYDDELQRLGILHHKRFRELRKELQALMYEDFQGLSRVSRFVRRGPQNVHTYQIPAKEAHLLPNQPK